MLRTEGRSFLTLVFAPNTSKTVLSTEGRSFLTLFLHIFFASYTSKTMIRTEGTSFLTLVFAHYTSKTVLKALRVGLFLYFSYT